MEATAKTKYLKGSPRKTRLVIDMIRGENVSRALSILKFTDKRAAGPISKCLNSAIANATYKAEQQNIAIDPDGLWVRTCYVDMGPTKNRRRVRPAPQGRAYREQRHYCHITIELTSEDKPLTEKEQKRADAAAKAEAGKAKAPKKAAKKSEPAKSKKAKEKPEAEVTAEATAEAAEVVETVETAETPVEQPTVETAAEAVEEQSETAEGGEEKSEDLEKQ
jgi:large subunit ribosomal protein L22